ncbi:helix-turn-helix transcriptional regulator [Nocardia sp. 348MFTsu5.1]|uniref:helix-turn-helix domain-containing protein n=1 Tax=Nocardia sp. 348MFTsu5.1 TaxID=1172185 RepID=UPI00048C6876|nr:helix-turn-helix transcriptional regulator [Nocardia sp. 348MFTsu5.1]
MSRRILRGFVPSQIAQHRKVRNMSRGELARLVGITTGAVGLWERGETTPAVDTLKRVADLLGAPMDEFIQIPPNERYLGDLRALSGMTQPQLAKFLPLSTPMLAALERGEARLTDRTAESLAKVLEVPVDTVVEAYERVRDRPANTRP